MLSGLLLHLKCEPAVAGCFRQLPASELRFKCKSAPQSASGSYKAPDYVSNTNRHPQSGSSNYQAPVYTPNKKGGSSITPGRPSSANWEYAKQEIAKHEELQNKLGAVGWVWKAGEYVAVNSGLEEVAALGLGPKPKGFIGEFVYDLAKRKIVDAAKDVYKSNKKR